MNPSGWSTITRIVRGALYKGFTAASELADGDSLALLAGRLQQNFRDCGRLTGELQRGPLLNIQNIFVASFTNTSISSKWSAVCLQHLIHNRKLIAQNYSTVTQLILEIWVHLNFP
jgi:hypothetical protein